MDEDEEAETKGHRVTSCHLSQAEARGLPLDSGSREHGVDMYRPGIRQFNTVLYSTILNSIVRGTEYVCVVYGARLKSHQPRVSRRPQRIRPLLIGRATASPRESFSASGIWASGRLGRYDRSTTAQGFSLAYEGTHIPCP